MGDSMLREIIFDTETTGLDPREDRVIEIGGVELVNRFPTGRTFHYYLNPQGRVIDAEALAVHGIGAADLDGKPLFQEVADEFLAFIDGASLVAHNAGFDVAFINAELERIGAPAVSQHRVVDTLALARRKHPLGPNSLDALCRRYGIDNSRRNLHGALLDSELLSEVYLELIGGRQAKLGLEPLPASAGTSVAAAVQARVVIRPRPVPLPPRLTEKERVGHGLLIEELGDKALWLKVSAVLPQTDLASTGRGAEAVSG
jgi:DNA polymerase-3 subunit epsilon